MFKQSRFAALLIALLIATGAFAVYGQETVNPAEPDPNAQITFPPPVYVLRGEFEVRGSANLAGMVGYFLEYRPLNNDFVPDENVLPEEDNVWLPATIPAGTPVVDDVLGVWDTTLNDDGLFELRLSILFEDEADVVQSVVSPLRIENEIPPFLTPEAPEAPVVTEEAFVVATAVPDTAPITSGAAIGTASVNGNVRTGDTTAYPVLTALRIGQQVDVVGISSTGSGWYQIRLPDGRLGFVAPTIINVTGDTSSLPQINPPPRPVTLPTNIPAAGATATAAPATGLPDAIITNLQYDRTIIQGQPFQFFLTIRNESDVALPGVIGACNFTPQNQLFSGSIGGLGARSQVSLAVTAQLDSGGGSNTTANCAVDVNNLVTESNEGNNFFNLTSLLSP